MYRNYRELRKLDTFEDRFNYLSLKGAVGAKTFGYDRHINQRFYRSSEWKSVRSHVIARDWGCDLGIPDREIHEGLLVHHMNPMVLADIVHGDSSILDPDFLITVSHATHNAIHYGEDYRLAKEYVPRVAGDTKLW